MKRFSLILLSELLPIQVINMKQLIWNLSDQTNFGLSTHLFEQMSSIETLSYLLSELLKIGIQSRASERLKHILLRLERSFIIFACPHFLRARSRGEPCTSVKNELSMSHDLMSPLYYYRLG